VIQQESQDVEEEEEQDDVIHPIKVLSVRTFSRSPTPTPATEFEVSETMNSPRPVTPKNDESFWDKLGTLGRKKKIKEGESTRT